MPRLAMLLWALGLFAALTGCVEERNFFPHAQRCATDRGCPSGSFCRDGICDQTPSRPPPDAGLAFDVDLEVLEESAADVSVPDTFWSPEVSP